MYFDEFKHQLPDIDPDRDRRLDRVPRPGRGRGRRGARPVHHLQAAQAGPPAPGRAAAADPDALHQHHQPRAGARLPGRRADGAPHPPADPLERRGDGPARQQQVLRDRRPPGHLCVRRVAVRGRLQPFLPRQGRRPERRPDLLPGSRGARASTLARSSRAGCRSTSSTTSGARPGPRPASARTRTRGSCPSSGSTRPCRWVSVPSALSTRPATTAIS